MLQRSHTHLLKTMSTTGTSSRKGPSSFPTFGWFSGVDLESICSLRTLGQFSMTMMSMKAQASSFQNDTSPQKERSTTIFPTLAQSRSGLGEGAFHLEPTTTETQPLTVTIRICPGRYLSADTMYSMMATTLALFDILPPKDEFGYPIAVNPKLKLGNPP